MQKGRLMNLLKTTKEIQEAVTPDQYIMDCFSEIFKALDITNSDIEAEMYDFDLPALDDSERELLGSQDGLLIDKATKKNINIAQPAGHMTYKGRPILVYLRDQFLNEYKYENQIYNPFHICFCSSLKEAQAQNRFENRYVMTYDTSGIFRVNISVRDRNYTGKVYTSSKEKDAFKKLSICQTCLHELGWNNFNKYIGTGIKWWVGGNPSARARIAREFNIKEFLQSCRKKPIENYGVDNLLDHPVYGTASNATLKQYHLTPEMKEDLKSIVENRCQICQNVYPSRKLQIHHKNHNEGDNRRENLLVICDACHDAIHKEEGGMTNYLAPETEIEEIVYADTNKQLGEIYSTGLGVEIDEQKANEHYGKAAESYESLAQDGHESAQYEIGMMYTKGLGVKKDEKKGSDWLSKFAKSTLAKTHKGDANACYNMSLLYAEGLGVSQDLSKSEEMSKNAYREYVKDLDKLSADELLKLSNVAPSETEKEQYKAKAVALYELCAEQGDSHSTFEMAKIIESECNVDDEVELRTPLNILQSSIANSQQIIEKFEDTLLNIEDDIHGACKKAIKGNIIVLNKLCSILSTENKEDLLPTLTKIAKQGNSTALEAIEKLADNGDIDAMVAMGDIYSSL